MKKNDWYSNIIVLILIVVILYINVAGIAWQINNPIANRVTMFTYFNDVIHFRSLPEFQPKED